VPSSLDETDTTATESSQSPSAFIDALLHDTYLFVMQVLHSPSLRRDAAFYRRGIQLVETMQRQLNTLSASASFIDHVTYAQCGLLDDAVLNSAPATENQVWLNSPSAANTGDASKIADKAKIAFFIIVPHWSDAFYITGNSMA